MLSVLVFTTLLLSVTSCKTNDVKSTEELFVGELSYDSACKNFFYNAGLTAFIQSAQGYEQLLGLDTTKDLRDQECPISETNQSWYEYLLEQATNQAVLISSQYQAALKDGYKDEDASNMVRNYIDYYTMLAEDGGFKSLDEYLESVFGEGVNSKVLNRLMTEQALAEKYVSDLKDGLEFSEEELKSYFEKNMFKYMEFSYLYAYVADDSLDVEPLLGAGSEEEFRENSLSLTGQKVYEMNSIKGAEIGDKDAEDVKWISNKERKPGDTYLGNAGNARYVLYFLSSDDLEFSQGGDRWRSDASSGLKEEWISNWNSELKDNAVIKGSWE